MSQSYTQIPTNMASITYTYSNGHISHFSLKKVEGSCHRDPDRTVLIGVMCKFCPHYCNRIEGRYVLCDWEGYQHDDDKDSTEVHDIRRKIYDRIEHDALCALDY